VGGTRCAKAGTESAEVGIDPAKGDFERAEGGNGLTEGGEDAAEGGLEPTELPEIGFAGPLRALDHDREQGEVGWGDPADSSGLAQGEGPDLVELLAGFGSKAIDGAVVDVGWDVLLLLAAHSFDRVVLAGNVARVPDIDLGGFPEIGREALAKGGG
jgi:hypothetical protein